MIYGINVEMNFWVIDDINWELCLLRIMGYPMLFGNYKCMDFMGIFIWVIDTFDL